MTVTVPLDSDPRLAADLEGFVRDSGVSLLLGAAAHPRSPGPLRYRNAALVADQEGKATTITYDLLGQQREIQDPDGGTRTFNYDAAGNLTVQENARGDVTRTLYDALHRPTGMYFDFPPNIEPGTTWPSPDVGIIYDDVTSRDRKLVTHSGEYERQYWYDGFGRRSKERLTTQGVTLLADYSYDLIGRPLRITYPVSSYSVEYAYSGAHLTSVCRGAANGGCTSDFWINSVTYSAHGRRDQIVMPSGTLNFDYRSTDHRLSRLMFTNPATQLHLSYEAYDKLGNPTTILDLSPSTANGATTAPGGGSYAYDGWNRVSQWNGLTYQYDALGNLTSRPVPGGTQTHTFDANHPHRLQKVNGGPDLGYDDDGNRVSQPAFGQQPARYYTFDSQSRLTRVGTAPGTADVAAHGYDLDGVRISTTTATETYVYLNDLFEYQKTSRKSVSFVYAFGELVGGRHVNGTSLRTHLPPALDWIPRVPAWPLAALGFGLLGGLAIRAGVPAHVRRRPVYASVSATVILCLVAYPAHGGGGGSSAYARWQIADPLGTTVVIVNNNGQVVSRQQRDPYGMVFAEWHSEVAEHRYAGKRPDPGSGLYDFSARWYDASVGSFLSVDPLIANTSDPYTIAAYAYARSNPMSFVDPTGMWFFSGLFASIGAFFAGAFANTVFSFSLSFGGFSFGSFGLDFSFQPGEFASADFNVAGLDIPLFDVSLQPSRTAFSSSGTMAPRTSQSGNGLGDGPLFASNNDGTVTDVPTLEDSTFASALSAEAGGPQVQEASLGGAAARLLGAAGKWVWNGAKYVWRNTSFDGPSPGAYHLNGRIVGFRWKQSQWGARLDIHPIDPGGPPVLHINYGPLGKGEAAHVKLLDPTWLRRE